MVIKSDVPYLSADDLEASANQLLDHYNAQVEAILTPPVPVEKIADFLLELGLEWIDIPDQDDAPILAYLHIASRTIRLNERRLEFFDTYPGTYAFTLAHEIGHYLLHVSSEAKQPQASQADDEAVLHRHKTTAADVREWQAEQFASYLLMPDRLIQPAIAGQNLRNWSNLYQLRDLFQVSITALRIRLEKLGLLYVAPNKSLYHSKSQALPTMKKDSVTLISQARLYRNLGDTGQAKIAYKQALALTQETRDKRSEAYCAWELGRLYLDTDLKRAVYLMSICVAYEKSVGHPEAEADALYLERLKLLSHTH
ncbi:MAG: ImmA/IrrE family metallo-endopeptidase [Chloroflexota bacterium]